MLPQRRWVRVPLGAPWRLAHVWFLVGVRAVLVLGSIRGVGEGLGAPRELTHVRLLPCVRPQVGLEVLQAGVSLVATLERALVWLLPRVSSHVHDQHILSLEGLLLTRAVLPTTHERLLVGVDVVVVQMLDKVILSIKVLVTLPPVAVSLDEVRRLFLESVLVPG